jgi:hypothetical protein
MGAGFGNLREIVCVFVARGLGLGNLDANVASVCHLVAQGLQPRLQPSYAHRRGPHVHPAAAGAQVKRNADDPDAAGGLYVRLMALARGGGTENLSGIRHGMISFGYSIMTLAASRSSGIFMLGSVGAFLLWSQSGRSSYEISWSVVASDEARRNGVSWDAAESVGAKTPPCRPPAAQS